MNAVLDASPRARILPVTEDQYFADPCEVPSLSQSIAHTLITRSPAHAYAEHPRLGKPADAEDEKATAAVNEGSVIHSLLLGRGAPLDVIKADNYTTKVAKELRDAALKAKRIPILEWRYDEIIVAAAALRANIAQYGIEFNGDSEVAIEWREPGIDGDVLCRGRMDHVVFDRGTVYDLKKISSADPRTCERHAVEYGYDIQHAAYTSAVSKLLPHFAGRVDFVFLFMEIEPPYQVVPCRPSGVLRELGERRWQRAVALWERCLRDEYWPGYTQTITTLEAPPWALAQEETINASI
jgi:hypothetical protein